MVAFVRQSELRDVIELVPILREVDRFELHAATGKAPEQCLLAAFSRPENRTYSVISDDQVISMFGVARITTGSNMVMGAPWFVCSDLLFERHKRRFIRESKTWIDNLSTGYTLLENVVLADNDVHVYWIQRCGFHLVERIASYGPLGRPFWRFRRLIGSRTDKIE